MSGETHPIYIDRDRKNVVKSEGAAIGEDMKTIIQRVVEHGLELNLHEVPVDSDITEVYASLSDEEIDSLSLEELEIE